jgi:hypothetical protein
LIRWLTNNGVLTIKNKTMASISETGHAKNIASEKRLIEINTGFGTDYAPTNPLLTLIAMNAQYTTSDGLQGDVNTASAVYEPIENARQNEFKPLKGLVRMIRSAAKACGAKPNWVADVNTIVTKILGERASKVKPITEEAKIAGADPAGTSASQQSFDNTTNNFDKLVKLLSTQPLYAPNEIDLKVTTLTAKKTALNNANNAAKNAIVPLKKAMIKRNKALYTPTTGLVDVGQASKDYVRSVFGYSSQEFKLVSKIKFVALVKLK